MRAEPLALGLGLAAVALVCANEAAKSEGLHREPPGRSPPRQQEHGASAGGAGILPVAQLEWALWAARICYYEAEFSEADCIAIYYVGERRSARLGGHWVEELLNYSTINEPGRRRRLARELPWGQVKGKSLGWNVQWQKLRLLVLRLGYGPAPANPCPGAEHWGEPSLPPRGRMVPIKCFRKTANVFYALR